MLQPVGPTGQEAGSPSAFAELKAFVAGCLAGGFLRAHDVAKFAHHALGEDRNQEGGGVSVAMLRSRLRPWERQPWQTVSASDLPFVLGQLCSLSFSQEQLDELKALTERIAPGAAILVPQRSQPEEAAAQIVPHANPAEKYASMSSEELRAELQYRDWQLAQSQQAAKASSKRMRYWRDRCQRLEDDSIAKDEQIRAQTLQLNMRPGNRNVSLLGGYLLAWKRNLSHTSAAALVSTLGGEAERGGLKSKDVVIRFEHWARSCQRFASQHFYATMLQQSLEAPVVPDAMRFVEVHAYMGDATNEEAVQKSKVHVAFVVDLCRVRTARSPQPGWDCSVGFSPSRQRCGRPSGGELGHQQRNRRHLQEADGLGALPAVGPGPKPRRFPSLCDAAGQRARQCRWRASHQARHRSGGQCGLGRAVLPSAPILPVHACLLLGHGCVAL